MSFQLTRSTLLKALTAGVLCVCIASQRTEASNTVPDCSTTSFKASDLSVVRVEIDYASPGPKFPDGCVLRFKANDGTAVAIRLTNVNTKKYRVVFDDKVEERPKEEVPGALAAFLAAGLPAFDSAAAKANVRSDVSNKLAFEVAAFGISRSGAPKVWDAVGTLNLPAQGLKSSGIADADRSRVEALVRAAIEEVARQELQIAALERFHATSQRLETVAKALKQALAASESAETYDKLLAEVKAALDPKVAEQPTLSACAGDKADPAQCRTGLEGLTEELEKSSFKPLAEDRMSVVEASKVPGASLESTYVAHAVETKYAAAIAMKEKLPTICKEVAAFYDEAGTKSSLFTKQKTFDFTGSPTRVSVRVESGPEKDAQVTYGMEVRIDPVRVEGFAFSTGFVFAGLSDHDYAVENGKIRRKGDSGPIRPGVGVLAHWRFKSDWALSAGISGSDSDLSYLVGASYLLGSKQRFVVTGGAAVGSVRRLDSVELDDPFTESTVPTKDVTAIGAFLGVSFKF